MIGTLIRMGFRVWVFSRVVGWIKNHDGLSQLTPPRS